MTHQFKIAVVGIGNILAGDDGVGVKVVQLLQEHFFFESRLFFLYLEGDLYEISDHLNRAEHFIFVDAVAGNSAGELVCAVDMPRAHAPSFHQTDIGAVMRCLQTLEYIVPFPSWDVCGVTVDPPRDINLKLSPKVEQALPLLVETVVGKIEKMLTTHAKTS